MGIGAPSHAEWLISTPRAGRAGRSFELVAEVLLSSIPVRSCAAVGAALPAVFVVLVVLALAQVPGVGADGVGVE